MKKTTIFAALLAAALLTGCGEDKPLDSTSSSSSSTTSTSNTSSSSSTTLSSSTAESSSSSTSSSSSSTSTPEPTPGSTTTSTTPEPTQSTSSSTTTPKPTQSSSSSSTPKPTQSSSSSSSFSSQPSTDPVTRFWNPDAPGNKPGPYGGYYDASGKLHCKTANMPTDDKGYPLISYYRETGAYIMTYAENQKYIEEERRISAGGQPDDGDFDWSRW